MTDFADLINDVALALCGKPNARLAGQFRYRFPHAPARSGWKYAAESEFRLIRPANMAM